ncbi:MAG: hypothetical protein WAO98_10110 [Alphaproteobacteria bacterium]
MGRFAGLALATTEAAAPASVKPADNAVCTVDEGKFTATIVTSRDQSVVDDVLARDYAKVPLPEKTAAAMQSAPPCTPADMQNGVYRTRELKAAPKPPMP